MHEINRRYLLNAGVAVGIALVVCSFVLAWAFVQTRRTEDAISVTGSARKRITSDLVVWSAAVTYQSAKLSDAYQALASNVPRVRQYLVSKGIADGQITVSSISTTTLKKQDENGMETSEITGYALRQQLEVRSNDVELISRVAREATELINQDILIESNAPQYVYTKLGDLKIEMLGEAALDAKTRAERIAASTGNSIGTVRSARMGVMQITAADSTEVSDQGISDTSTIEKDITAVVNISFAIH